MGNTGWALNLCISLPAVGTMSYWCSLKTGEAVGHVPTMMVFPWSLRVTTIACGLASTMEMLETLFPGTMTLSSKLKTRRRGWRGADTRQDAGPRRRLGQEASRAGGGGGS